MTNLTITTPILMCWIGLLAAIAANIIGIGIFGFLKAAKEVSLVKAKEASEVKVAEAKAQAAMASATAEAAKNKVLLEVYSNMLRKSSKEELDGVLEDLLSGYFDKEENVDADAF